MAVKSFNKHLVAERWKSYKQEHDHEEALKNSQAHVKKYKKKLKKAEKVKKLLEKQKKKHENTEKK